jgi:cytochrome c-type biogenesis protein CcmE
MNKRALYLCGGALLVAFAGFSLSSFNESLTPYVSYREARSMARTVQVAGALEAGSSAYDMDSEALRFTLRDPATAETMRVRYHGLKPANFEEAVSIVAIGRFDPAAQELHAEKLLVKCPSKYQGLETKTYS